MQTLIIHVCFIRLTVYTYMECQLRLTVWKYLMAVVMYSNTDRKTPNRRIYAFLFSAWLLIPTFVIAYAYQSTLLEAQGQFEQKCGRLKDFLFERLNSNEAVISGFVSFLGASDKVDYHKASLYAKHILNHYPHINTIEFVEAVKHEELESFTEWRRQQGLDNFTIRTFDYLSDRQWHPIEEKPVYFPLTFMEPPLPEAREVLGLDLHSVPFLREAMVRSSHINNTAATQPFELAQGGRAFGLIQPVPDPGITRSDMAQKYAILIITSDSLLKDAPLTLAPGLHIALHFGDIDDHNNAPDLFQFNGGHTSYLEQLLLPRLSIKEAFRRTGQNYYFHATKQITWGDINTSLLFKLFFAAVLTCLLLLIYLKTILHIEEERLALNQQLEYKAFHDDLTGIANRALIIDRLNHAINNASRASDELAVMFLDLDRFKAINDNFGHETGDVLLMKFAERLRGHVRKNDTVGRLGGDEFIIILEHIKDQADAEVLANKLHGLLCEPYFHKDLELHIGVSIGIAYFPDDGSTCTELLQKADEGMYCNKQYQCHRPESFSPE